MKKPLLLPPSLSDEVPILLPKDNDDADVTDYLEAEEDRENESGESSSEITDEELPGML